MIDLDDTTRCPTDIRCASCRQRGDLTICTLATPIGVLCRSLCQDCIDDQSTPRLSLRQAVTLVMRHCKHLGIDLDEMAELTRLEARR